MFRTWFGRGRPKVCPASPAPARGRSLLHLEPLEARHVPSCSISLPNTILCDADPDHVELRLVGSGTQVMNVPGMPVLVGHLVQVHGGGGADTLHVDDSGIIGSYRYAVRHGQVLVDLAHPAAPFLAVHYADISGEVKLTTSGGADDVGVDVASYPAGGSTVRIDGGAGSDRLVVNDTAFSFGYNYAVTGGKVLVGPAVVSWLAVYYGNLHTLELATGDGDDLIEVQATAPGVATMVRAGNLDDTIRLFPGSLQGPLAVQGEGGRNTLDYALYGADVQVNLQTGVATDLQAFSGIQNVTGGAGNDVLIGDGQVNHLIGNAGRDLLFAGPGPAGNRLEGGAGDDILLAGTTVFDGDDALLGILRDVWCLDLTCDERVSIMQSFLNPHLGTVVGFGSGNTTELLGQAGDDLFYANPWDVHDARPDEVLMWHMGK